MSTYMSACQRSDTFISPEQMSMEDVNKIWQMSSQVATVSCFTHTPLFLAMSSFSSQAEKWNGADKDVEECDIYSYKGVG